MKIRYTPGALRQLNEILDYIDERNPQGSLRVKSRIQAAVNLLAVYPFSGQATERPAQRRVVTTPYPYVIFYRVMEDEVIIERIRHSARRPIA